MFQQPKETMTGADGSPVAPAIADDLRVLRAVVEGTAGGTGQSFSTLWSATSRRPSTSATPSSPNFRRLRRTFAHWPFGARPGHGQLRI